MEVLRSLEVGKYTPGDTRLIPEDPKTHLSLLYNEKRWVDEFQESGHPED